MKYICAPDSFKESLSATEAAAAMARGIKRSDPAAEIDLCPIADGGEGTAAAMLKATGGKAMTCPALSPLSEPLQASWALLGRRGHDSATAVVEMAAASGLALIPPHRRNPTRTTSFGTGQMILAALNGGARRIILGIGGSATNDGGTGMAQALGAVFRDGVGRTIAQPMTGGLLADVADINLAKLDPRIPATNFVVACDVTNPLTGPEGAAAIYSPQKGATPVQVKELERNLVHLASLIRTRLGMEVERIPGAGAAGGMGAGAMAFLRARIRPGAQLVLETVGFNKRVAGRDCCLTGEGRLDEQSLSGKACLGVAAAARRAGVPTYALVGSVGPGSDRALTAGLTGFREIGAGLPVAESMRRAAELLEKATAELMAGLLKK